MFFHSFIFKCKLPKTQYSSYLSHHVWEVGSRLKSQTFFKYFVQRKTNYLKTFSKFCFFNFFMFDVEPKVVNNKIPEAKPSHLTNDLQLTSQTVRFYLPAYFIFWWKVCFSFWFQILTKFYYTLLSWFVMFLILKTHKKYYYVSHNDCEVVHDCNKRQFIHSFCFMENNRP